MHADPAISAPAAQPVDAIPATDTRTRERCGAPTPKGTCGSVILCGRLDPDGKRRCGAHAVVNRAVQRQNGVKGVIARELRARKRQRKHDQALDVGLPPPDPVVRIRHDPQTPDGWRAMVAQVARDVLQGDVPPGNATAAIAALRLLLDERAGQAPDASQHVAALLEALEKP